MSAKFATDKHGRLIAIVTASSDAGQQPGDTFLVLGNDLPSAERGIRWLGRKTGRPAEPVDDSRRPNRT